MEDEMRPLPKGWVRSYDPQQNHQFFVNTTKDPPTSIWHHPYDDEDYLKTLSSEERERIEQESIGKKHPSIPDIMAEDTDNEDDDHHHDPHGMPSKYPSELPPRDNGNGQPKGISKWGRKMKDKVTNSTHEQREVERKRRAEEERKAYEQHMVVRKAMSEAMRTGNPVKVGKDKDGKDVFVEPPRQQSYTSPYGNAGYGYSPYSGGYGSPYGGYRRPMGMGYGGGMGMPLMLGAGGGLMGGMMLGDMMGGGFGGGGFGC